MSDETKTEDKPRKYNVGDVVKFKSGGPPMTVSYAHGDSDNWLCDVRWFSGRHLEELDDVDEVLLEPTEPHWTE